jgi:hypothetical protein
VERTICHGCAEQERLEHWKQTRVITTGVIFAAFAGRKRPEIRLVREALDRIQAAVDVFDRNVWRSLRAHLKGHCERGESLEFQGMKVLTFVVAGRVMITLEDEASSLTLITTEDEDSRMGIQGIAAREHQALDLLERATLAWELGHRTKPDHEVRIAGV